MSLCSIIPLITGAISLLLGYFIGKVKIKSKNNSNYDQSDFDELFNY